MTKRTSSELKRLAREFLTGNYPVPISASLLSALLPSFLLSAFQPAGLKNFNFTTFIFIAAAFILSIFANLLFCGVLRIHLLLARKEKASLADLFWVFHHQPDRFILAVLSLELVFLIPALVLLAYPLSLLYQNKLSNYFIFSLFLISMILLIVIELYIYCSFFLVFLLYLDFPSYGLREAFGLSCRFMQGNKRRLLYMLLSFTGWYLLGLLSVGIGFLWIKPYQQQTFVNLYLDITDRFQIEKTVSQIHIDTFI